MYLKITYGTSEVKSSSYNLTEYINSNYEDDLEDCKSMIRYCFFINGPIIFWYNKKQQTVSISRIKTEYIV